MWQTSKWILAGLWVCAAGCAVYAFVGVGPAGWLAILTEHLSVLILAVVALGLLVRWAFYQDALSQLRRRAWVYASSQQLRPTHIRSAVWYRSFFIERPAVDLTLQALLQRQGVVLRGAPLVGKTRCAYEVLKRLRGYWILGLAPTNQHIADIKIPRSYFFGRVRLILLLDDLPRYVGKFSLGSLLAHLRRHTTCVSVLATCSTDDARVLQHGDFYACVTQTLQDIRVEPFSQAEEEQLAHACEQPWETTDYTGTPGVLALNLGQHKQRLDAARYESQRLMRAVSLMDAAGIYTYSQALVERVAKRVYGLLLPPREIEQVWRGLCETGLVAVEQGLVRAGHTAYCRLLPPLSEQHPQLDTRDRDDTPDAEDGHNRHIEPKEMEALWQLVGEYGDPHTILDMVLRRWIIDQDLLRAEQGLRQYVNVSPRNAAGHYNLGLLLAGNGRSAEAIQAFRIALSTDPLHAGAHYNLGVLFAGDGLRQEAAEAFRAALHCDPLHAGAHNNLGLLLVSQERIQEAGQAFQAALRCDPNLASAHYNMGLLLAKQSLAKEAALAFDSAVRCDSEHTGAHNNLGVLLAGQGRVSEAAQAFRAALSADPDDADAHYNLGVLLAGQGQIDTAAQEYRAALRCYPAHANAHRSLDSLLTALAGQAHLHSLTQEVRLALSYTPGTKSDIGTSEHNQLGVTLVQAGCVAEAQREFEAAVQENPTDASAHYNLGVIWANRERVQEAEHEFLATLRCDPNHAGAHNNLGVLRVRQGRLAEAEYEYRAALVSEPSDAQVYTNLAILLARTERTSEANAAFQDALRCNPHDAGVS